MRLLVVFVVSQHRKSREADHTQADNNGCAGGEELCSSVGELWNPGDFWQMKWRTWVTEINNYSRHYLTPRTIGFVCVFSVKTNCVACSELGIVKSSDNLVDDPGDSGPPTITSG